MAIAVREGVLTEEEFELVVDVFKILKQWRDEAAATRPVSLVVKGEVTNGTRMGYDEQQSPGCIASQ